MKSLEQIRQQLREGDFEHTEHSRTRAVIRNISDSEIIEAGSMAMVVEEYPDRRYGPSMLLFGITDGGRPLHFVVALADSPRARIVTIYDPDPTEWRDFWTRRQS